MPQDFKMSGFKILNPSTTLNPICQSAIEPYDVYVYLGLDECGNEKHMICDVDDLQLVSMYNWSYDKSCGACSRSGYQGVHEKPLTFHEIKYPTYLEYYKIHVKDGNLCDVRIDNLSFLPSSVTNEYQRLQSDVDTLQLDNKSLRSTNDSLRSTNDSLRQQLENIQDRYQHLSIGVDNDRTRIKNLEDIVKKQHSQNKRLCEMQETTISQLDAEIDENLSIRNQLTQQSTMNEQLHKQCVSLQTEVCLKNQEIYRNKELFKQVQTKSKTQTNSKPHESNSTMMLLLLLVNMLYIFFMVPIM